MVFDLLYRGYTARLQPFAMRLEASRPYKSEHILLTLLHEIPAEEPYTGFFAGLSSPAAHLLPRPHQAHAEASGLRRTPWLPDRLAGPATSWSWCRASTNSHGRPAPTG
jgi:hypothetical protein